MRPRPIIASLIALLSLATTTLAQPLVDRIPDDAMVYVGWRGTAQLGDAYQSSHLKNIVDASDWKQFFDQFLPDVFAKIGQQDADAAEVLRLASSVASAAGKHETAFYFGGLIAGQRNGPPAPKLAFLIRAGSDSADLSKRLDDAIQKGGSPFPIKVASYGDLVAVTTGAWPGFETLLGATDAQVPAAPSLKSNAKFTAALEQAQKDAALVVYVDAEAIIKMADGFIALGAQPDQQRIWRKARQIAGLAGLRQIIATGGFDGKDWVSQCFLGAPAPRPGLLALLDGQPLSDDILKLVPHDSTLVSAGRFNFAAVLDSAHKLTASADPQWGQHVDQVLSIANQWAGMDLERDLLDHLGQDWAFYTSPSTGGGGLLGGCLVNRPRDPAKLEAALSSLEKRATESLHGQTGPDVTIAFKTRQINGLTLHYLAVPILTPTWTISDGTLYVAAYPQVVLAAVAQAKQQGGKSILDNEHFAAVRNRLGAQNAISVSYADLPRTAPNAYSSWLLITRYAGVSDLFGIDSPLMLIPPIDRLMPELAPAGQTSWVDDAGLHVRHVTPFPGADTLAQDPLGTLMTAQPAIMMSILLPSLNRARETANRVKSASNLRQIGQGCFLYSNEHNGKFPASLAEIARTQDIDVDAFANPNSNTSVPHNLAGKEQVAAWVEQNADYVYLGAGKTNAESPETIIAYEKPEPNNNEGMNVLFGDGHVEWLNHDAAMQQIEKQTKKDSPAGKL